MGPSRQRQSRRPASSSGAQPTATSTGMWAGVARADITDYQAGPVNDPLYVKALVLRQAQTSVAIVSVDAVALGEIGRISNDFLANVRAALQKAPGLDAAGVLVNASHCHGVVCTEVEQRTIDVVRQAWERLEPVRVGSGSGHEDRIMENRRLRLNNGREADVRHAYSLPPDEDVAGVGPIDPQIGILRLDRLDGQPLAVLYNIACHPIQGVPSGGNTADLVGFASKAIENSLGPDVIALFLQGCAGDINPVFYKDVDRPRDAEPLGNRLGLSVLQAVRRIPCHEGAALKVVRRILDLPRADLAPAIAALEAEQTRLLESLGGTTLNLKTFLQLLVRHGLAPGFPAYYSHRYLHEKAMGRDDLVRLDAANRQSLEKYVANIHTMEQLTRVRTNLALLKMHQAQNAAAGKATLSAEVMGLRIGDFVLITFPGELSVQIGLNLKQRSPHPLTFITGCTNGYLYYAPTAEQLRNRGGAQEDSDCLLAPEWQAIFEQAAESILKVL